MSGKGKFSRRSMPVAASSDVVEALDAPLPADQRNCPECNAPLVTHHEEVTVEDIPPQPQRVIKRIQVEVGKCPICGFTVRGHHPSMGSHQWGANAHQLGPRVLAHALALHYDSGLPLRKVPKVIAELTGITLSQSALTQRAGKLCEEGGVLAAHYQKLREEVANSAVVNTDKLRQRELSDEDNRRLLKGIRLQHERGRLSLFLHEPEIEPTNNRAERGLRPVVIARKVSQCSKNERGANSYAVLRTVFETLRRRTSEVIGAFTDLLCAKPFPLPSQVR